MAQDRKYQAPSAIEKTLNRMLGFVANLGIGPAYVYLLQVKGRKSGKTFSTPVSLLELDEKQFLVAPRGRTQWVRNAEAAGEITLKKRGTARKFRIRPLDNSEKPVVLKAYLTNYKGAVGRFFPIPPDSAVQSFAQIADGYPAFELIPQ